MSITCHVRRRSSRVALLSFRTTEGRESCWNKQHLGQLQTLFDTSRAKASAASQQNPLPLITYPVFRMADDVSRVKYSCSQVAETVRDETKQLDFYFLYKIETEVDSKVELNRLQVAYVYNLASKLLPCTDSEDTNNESKSNDHLFTVVAIDSAKQDEQLEIGEKQTREIHVVVWSRLFPFVSPLSTYVFTSLDRTLRSSWLRYYL